MTETLEARKSRQRTELRQRLADIGEGRQRSAAAEIDRLLRERLGDRLAEGVLAFHPLPDEPDLRPLLQHLLGLGHLICLPGVDWEKKTMTPLRLESLDGTRRGRHGVIEPEPRTPIDAGELSLVLVPGLGFDRRGRRLGRGGGFYDRFLADCPPQVLPVGVAFDDQLVERVETGPHDIPLPMVITDTGIIEPGSSTMSAR